MKRIINFISLILLVTFSPKVASAQSAADVLTQCANKIKAAKSLVAAYTISADGQSQSGIMTISGDRFTISSPQMVTWFDGKTQWTYSSHTGEVNITDPTPEELQQINPFAIIRAFSSAYKSQLLKSTTGSKKIRLTALSPKSDIKGVILTINDKTLFPSNIDLTLSNNQSVSIVITRVETGGTLPMSHFRFDAKKYPGVNVIDLR